MKIEEHGIQENVFIEIDENAQIIWQKYEDIRRIEDRILLIC